MKFSIYQPAQDSYLLEKQIKRYAARKSCLDMGSGSGILAEACKKSKASSVIAIDINKKSIKLLRQKGISAIKSDLFKEINGKFDLIVFNPPYLPLDQREPKDSQLATTGGKNGDEIILRFLKQVPKHINNNSIILLLVSSLTPLTKIITSLSKLGLKHKKIAEEKLFCLQLKSSCFF